MYEYESKHGMPPKYVVQVLNIQDIHKLVFVNEHEGNNFKQIIRELSVEFSEFFIFSLNWCQVIDRCNYFDEPGNHAGEFLAEGYENGRLNVDFEPISKGIDVHG